MRKNIKKLKKFTAMGMIAALSVSMIACGKQENTESKKDTTQAEETTEEGFKFLRAVYSNGKITVEGNEAFEGELTEVISLTDEEGNKIPVKGITKIVARSFNINLEQELSINKMYTVSYEGKSIQVNLSSLYSKENFESKYTYEGDDLGCTYSKDKTVFKVWAPTAKAVKVNLYKSGTKGTDDLIESIDMKAGEKGTWVAEKTGDLNGTYYTYSVNVNNNETEACDPYARTTGVNGDRAMVIDLKATNPDGWDKDSNPNKGLNITDAVIYELHLRDISADSSSGITNKGKYLGLTETGTKNDNGDSTGIDYIKDLGVNYVHIMPMYDYGSVDETKLDTAQYNWGYDPVNYNVPEGSYATDSYNGKVRVEEAKQMVKALHDSGISVIMDVVYNHVYDAQSFCFNKIVPDYFSRIGSNGSYSNGSGCGNDVASERAMVSKYIVDSVKYWADEYHIDGFRFDLVGLIDVDTLNTAITEVHKTNPDVIFYGEGWTLSTEVTKGNVALATQSNSSKLPEFAFFNDYFRDNLRGSNSSGDKGYINGSLSTCEAVKDMLRGKSSFTSEPARTINYSGCHDNNTIFDKLTLSDSSATMDEKIAMNKLAAAITLTSQGVPFLMSGEELLRTKTNEDGSLNSNSYNSPDSVNSIKWSTLAKDNYKAVHDYYKGLIEFRNNHKGLRMTTGKEAADNITVMDNTPKNVVAYSIKGGANGETSKGIFVIYNGTGDKATVTLPEGSWSIYINNEKAGNESLGSVSGSVEVEKVSAMVLVME